MRFFLLEFISFLHINFKSTSIHQVQQEPGVLGLQKVASNDGSQPEDYTEILNETNKYLCVHFSYQKGLII